MNTHTHTLGCILRSLVKSQQYGGCGIGAEEVSTHSAHIQLHDWLVIRSVSLTLCHNKRWFLKATDSLTDCLPPLCVRVALLYITDVFLAAYRWRSDEMCCFWKRLLRRTLSPCVSQRVHRLLKVTLEFCLLKYNSLFLNSVEQNLRRIKQKTKKITENK